MTMMSSPRPSWLVNPLSFKDKKNKNTDGARQTPSSSPPSSKGPFSSLRLSTPFSKLHVASTPSAAAPTAVTPSASPHSGETTNISAWLDKEQALKPKNITAWLSQEGEEGAEESADIHDGVEYHV
jgi:hypothetical protein